MGCRCPEEKWDGLMRQAILDGLVMIYGACLRGIMRLTMFFFYYLNKKTQLMSSRKSGDLAEEEMEEEKKSECKSERETTRD